MSCPHREDLISFAIDPLHEKYADLAGHISECESCQNALNDINYTIMLSEEVTESDIMMVKGFVAENGKKKSADQWKQLKDTVENIWKQISSIPDFFGDSLAFGACAKSIGGLFSPVSGVLSGVSSLVSSRGTRGTEFLRDMNAVNIGFAADCDVTSPYYWRAEMVIPSGVTADTMLVILLTNSKGQEITAGTFTLLGEKLNLDYGIAEISFKDFRKNLRNTTVELTWSDGKTVAGDLVPWKYAY